MELPVISMAAGLAAMGRNKPGQLMALAPSWFSFALSPAQGLFHKKDVAASPSHTVFHSACLFCSGNQRLSVYHMIAP